MMYTKVTCRALAGSITCVLAWGCGNPSSVEPEPDPPTATWSVIQSAILDNNCVECHVAGSSFAQQSDLILTSNVAYDQLVNRMSNNAAARADGLVLVGTEVKALREGKAQLKDSYATVRNGELYLMKAHISAYNEARDNHEPERPRKLLLHRREIHKLSVRVRERGYTLVPLEMYFKNGRAKISLALGRGKKNYDKRRAVAKRDSDRQLARVTKNRRLGRR